MNTELIKMSRKAADTWKNTDGCQQAAHIIDMLIDEILFTRGCRDKTYVCLNNGDWETVLNAIDMAADDRREMAASTEDEDDINCCLDTAETLDYLHGEIQSQIAVKL